MVDLTTQCPRCGTRFLVSPEQLQLRKGYIRCLHCAHIFDGYEAVVAGDEAEAPVDAPAASPATPRSPSPATTPSIASTGTPAVVRRRGEFTISGTDVAPGGRHEPTVVMSGEAAPEPGPEPTMSFVAPVAPRDIRMPSHTRDARGAHEPWVGVVRALWLGLIVLGLGAAALQAAVIFRVQLAERLPQMRPALERLCASLHCQVPYGRHPDMIVITHSSLQQGRRAAPETDATASPDTEERTAYLLEFTLRNRHSGAQEWPTVVLELKDAAGATVARRNLPASNYLPGPVQGLPFPANSERRVRLPLQVSGLKLNGYQLTTFFP